MSGNLFDIRGRVALITGANAGIGFGYAEAIAQQGGDVVIWGRRADKNEEARQKLAAYGGRVFTDVVDVADEAQQIQGFEKAIAAMGHIDCVIANAGFMVPCAIKDMSLEAYRSLNSVAQDGAFITLREGAKHMLARVEAGGPPGSLLATGSLSNFQGLPGGGHYAAAKCAVAAIIKTLSTEYAAAGIRANMICVGLTENEHMNSETPAVQGLIQLIPAKRMGTSKDLAGMVVYLMSDAAAYHTGDLITIDGGSMASLY